MTKIKHLDYFLLFIVSLLLILGISFLATISSPVSFKKFGTGNYYLIHQLTNGLFPGIVLGLILFLMPFGFLRRVSPCVRLINLVLLILVFFPQIGSRFWGASRWLNLGIISFQPSEFLKITSILYLSSWLNNRLGLSPARRLQKDKKIFLPFVIFLGVISLLLVLQPDVSTLGIIGVTAVVIYLAAGTPLWHTFLIVCGAVSSLFLLIKIEPYRFSRIIVFLNPETDPQGIGYQMKQALISIGSGGLAGQGLGMSSKILPQSMSDSTFALFAQELGFAGCFVLILLFLMFLWLGLMIAKRAENRFSKLTALGITFWIVFQGFVNIGSISGLLPLTGLPLPFISYGGSHIVSELMGVGILLNIARRL